MVKQITFQIDASGEVSVQVTGAKGKECDGMTEDFEALLGEVTKKKYKDEFYESVGETNEVESRG